MTFVEGDNICIMKDVKLLFLFSFLFIIVSCSEQADRYYKTYQDAQRANAIEKGLLPKIIPLSAKEIFQTQYIDIPGTRVKFIVDSDAIEEIKGFTKELGENDLNHKQKQLGWLPKWWPNELNKIDLNTFADKDILALQYNYELEYGDGHKENKIGLFFIYTKAGQVYYLNN
jgi:hypothetical protein